MTNENEEKNKNKKEEANNEEYNRYIRRLLDSEAETRGEPPIEPKKDQPVNPDGTTRASSARKTPTPNPTTSRNTPPSIGLDKDNMPLPRRVDEIDMEGTRVTPVAYEPASRPRKSVPQTRSGVPLQSRPISQPRPPQIGVRDLGGCLARLLVLALFGVVILSI